MTQTLLSFDTPPLDPLDRVGFDLGWDHARHGVAPPAELLDGTPVSQGWMAGRAVFGHRHGATTRGQRTWLALRLEAWRAGAEFDAVQVTPHYLQQIDASHCPVTRQRLGGTGDDAAQVVRLREDAGYAAGNLVVLCRLAARAKAGLTAAQAQRHAERLARDGVESSNGLSRAAWGRLATLMSLAVELPQVQAARVPLHVLPPNRVRVLNPSQGLQAVLTLRLQSAGWSRRARAMADLLPRPGLRHDFNLFVGALAARLMSIAAGAAPRETRWALEDAWADGRVQRRWAQFVVHMDLAESEAWLQRLAGSVQAGGTGPRLLVHERAGATDGWALPSGGRLERPAQRAPARLVPGADGGSAPS